MTPLKYFGVHAQQVATHPVNVTKMELTFVGDTASWIQIHDSQGAISNGAIPIKSYYVPVGSTTPQYFRADFIAGELPVVNGLYIAVSSTEATYTAATKNMDLYVELKQPEQPSGVLTAGNLASGVNGLQVWTEANGLANGYKLHRIIYEGQQNDSSVVALMLFAKDSPQAGETPIKQWAIPDNAEHHLDFGTSGLVVYSQDSNGTARRGCTIKASSTTGTYTASTAIDVVIYAEYKV